ncbi:MAG TPA: tryptophan synthase subunit alpha, partial [Longimicrobiales bacterium]|nr:tryptophan synthase subunit alpha [Longimicrobiales bacterium]
AEVRDPGERLPDVTPSITDVLAARKAEGRAALVPYVTAGHPGAGVTPELLRAVADASADVIELGIPFSDPLADGPTIQRSSFQALAQGATAAGALEALRTFRTTHATPVVLFTYLNPVLRYGVPAFLSDAREAGAQGLLVTDLPTGADAALEDRIRASGLDLIRLVAPTTPAERIPVVAGGGSGFLYYISRTGVTGAREELRATLGEEVARVRDAVSLPVAVGFGISTPEQAAAVAAVADGVVVGSALIQALDAGGVEGGAAFVAALRRGMDGHRGR